MKIINKRHKDVHHDLVEIIEEEEPEIDTKADLIVIAKYIFKTASNVPVVGWLLALFIGGVVLASIAVMPFVLFMVAYHMIHRNK